MNNVSRTKVDQLGDRLRVGVSEDDIRLLDAYRRSFADAYGAVLDAARSRVGRDPTGRSAKSTTSIVEKLQRESIRLSQMQDIAGCRVVVDDIVAQDIAVEALTGELAGAHVVDRRVSPSHGYRAVHIVAFVDGIPVEIQIRTILQHLWAELSEVLSDRRDPAIKYGGGPPVLQEVLAELSNQVKQVEGVERGAFLSGNQSDVVGPRDEMRNRLLASIKIVEEFGMWGK